MDNSFHNGIENQDHEYALVRVSDHKYIPMKRQLKKVVKDKMYNIYMDYDENQTLETGQEVITAWVLE